MKKYIDPQAGEKNVFGGYPARHCGYRKKIYCQRHRHLLATEKSNSRGLDRHYGDRKNMRVCRFATTDEESARIAVSG
jgi:hypothetical protein